MNNAMKQRENNRMGKTRDLFKKIGDIKGTLHARIGMIKDRNGKDLTETKEIKQRWQEYTEELYRKATPVFLPGESHGQRSLVGYIPWYSQELDTTE